MYFLVSLYIEIIQHRCNTTKRMSIRNRPLKTKTVFSVAYGFPHFSSKGRVSVFIWLQDERYGHFPSLMSYVNHFHVWLKTQSYPVFQHVCSWANGLCTASCFTEVLGSQGNVWSPTLGCIAVASTVESWLGLGPKKYGILSFLSSVVRN